MKFAKQLASTLLVLLTTFQLSAVFADDNGLSQQQDSSSQIVSEDSQVPQDSLKPLPQTPDELTVSDVAKETVKAVSSSKFTEIDNTLKKETPKPVEAKPATSPTTTVKQSLDKGGNKVDTAKTQQTVLLKAFSVTGNVKVFTDEKQSKKSNVNVSSLYLEKVTKDYLMLKNKSGTTFYASPSATIKLLDTKHTLNQKEVEFLVNQNKVTSKTNYLLFTQVDKFNTFVLTKKNSNWVVADSYSVGVGQLSDDKKTIKGTFEIYRKQTDWHLPECTVYYPMSYHGGFAFHSTLFGAGKNDKTAIDTRTKGFISHGCFRQELSKAKLLYSKINIGTKVINI